MNDSQRERKREYNKKYYQLNKEKRREQKRKYREENKKKIREYGKKYREENKKKQAEYDKKWREDNKEKKREQNRKYRKNARIKCIEYLGGKCVKCGTTKRLEFDHIDRTTKKYTIAPRVTNNFDNLKEELNKCQLLCAFCHLNKTESEWTK